MLFKTKTYFWIFALLGIVFLFPQCKKDSINPDNITLTFSTDTLTFDTLFVSLGSATKFITIRNPYNQEIEIDQIKLSEEMSSFFRINVDGESGNEFENVTILPKDSIYIFVEVTVDPGLGNIPFLIEDAIEFKMATKKQKVVLNAYGQNARFYNGEEIETETWDKDLPYVILGGLLVKPGHTLTIKEGVTVYMGGSAGFFVQGTLKIEGTVDEPVTFRGVRLDNITSTIKYDEIPGQWLGIFLLRDSKGNHINYARIRNAQYGISMGSTTDISTFNSISLSDAPELFIQNSIVHNISVFGLYGILSKIIAENLLVYDCGVHALAFQAGGDYEFTHCTVYNQGTSFLNHKDPSFYASNYFIDSDRGIDVRKPIQLEVINSILFGTLLDEVVVDSVKNVGYDVLFSNSLIRTRLATSTSWIFDNCIFNELPQFTDVSKKDFTLLLASPCINYGIVTSVVSDLKNNLRDGQPDLGVYEFIP